MSTKVREYDFEYDDKIVHVRIETYKGKGGIYKEIHYFEGILTSESNYKDGKLHGLYRWYYKDGKVNGEQIFENGNLNGIQTIYQPNGKLFRVIYYRNNRIKWDKQYFKRKERVCEMSNYGKRYIISREYYLNGKFKRRYVLDKNDKKFEGCFD